MTVNGTSSERWADAEEQLYRIAQEALANAVRHAQAREVRLEICYEDKALVLRISDDGRGFDLDSAIDADGHCGLISMKERAETVGGRLNIATAIGHGARIEAVVPTPSTERQNGA